MRLSFSVLAACAGLGSGALASDLPRLPSGLAPELMEMFLDVKPDGRHTYARFRFVAPALGGAGAPDYDVLAEDFMLICREYVLPRVQNTTEPVDRIVISYSDRPVEFGMTDPDAKQFFEQFSIKNGDCIWEQF